MSQKLDRRYCWECARSVLAVGSPPNHLLHLFLTSATCGLWAPVWALVALASVGGYRCPKCGAHL